MVEGSRSPFECRGCGSRDVDVLLDLGQLPLANAFVRSPSEDSDRFTEHLTLVMCNQCLLIQIRDEVPRERLFSTFLWVTGTSQAAASHAQWLSERLRDRHLHPDRRFLVEVASNDGFFMRHYRDAGFDVLGVDPADVTAEAISQGLPTIRDFFGLSVAERIVARARAGRRHRRPQRARPLERAAGSRARHEAAARAWRRAAAGDALRLLPSRRGAVRHHLPRAPVVPDGRLDRAADGERRHEDHRRDVRPHERRVAALRSRPRRRAGRARRPVDRGLRELHRAELAGRVAGFRHPRARATRRLRRNALPPARRKGGAWSPTARRPSA